MLIRRLFTYPIFRGNAGRKLNNPSAERNCQPILSVLSDVLDKTTPNQKLLEISSGTGQHAAYIAQHFPNINFCPSEFDASLIGSIRAFAAEVHTNNVRPPIVVDIRQPFTDWNQSHFDSDGRGEFDYVLNINMIHITPLDCTEGLFQNANALLKGNGLLITYGPYAINGVLVPESNINFDRYLRSQNVEWGVRDISDLKGISSRYGIALEKILDMPANNKICIWRKTVGLM